MHFSMLHILLKKTINLTFKSFMLIVLLKLVPNGGQ